MMELRNIKVSVIKSDKTVKELEESCDGSLSSLIVALKNIRSTTNDYLTEMVDAEKSLNSNQKSKSKAKVAPINDENEESDVEIEEDFIDSQIKQQLSARHSSRSHDKKRSEKRTRSQGKNNKKLKQ